MVLLLDEIEFLFDPLASVRHREFQPASSPAATAATLQGKKKRDWRNEGIQLAMYTRQCERDGGIRAHVGVKTVRGTHSRRISRVRDKQPAVTLWHCV